MKTDIYVLAHPLTGEIRYVGKSVDINARYYRHLYFAKAGAKQRVCNWIRSLLKRNLQPICLVMETVNGDGCKEEIEWIATLRKAGCRLTNLTDGGEGTLGFKLSDEIKQKISKIKHGKTFSEEHKQKIGQAHRGKTISEEHKQKIKNALSGVKLIEETKIKISKSNLGKHSIPLSEEAKRKISEARRGKPLTEEHKRKISEGLSRQQKEKKANDPK